MPAAFRIEHRLGIPVPPQIVWRVLSDLPGWAAWNPLYIRAEGELRIGETLRLTEALPGAQPADLAATVIDWVPDNQILLEMRERAGLVRRMRYLEIEKLSDEASVFSNGEDWWGRLARWTPRPRRRSLRAGYQAMSEALSERAIALWRQEGGAPTSGA